jgi:hypothetical protein
LTLEDAFNELQAIIKEQTNEKWRRNKEISKRKQRFL